MSALREALGNLPEAVFADLLESDEAYRVVLDLPGGRLRIEARRDKDVPTAFRYVTEERSLFLDTELPLPPTVDAPDATATVERGVLTVTLPKTAVTGGTSVPVSDA